MRYFTIIAELENVSRAAEILHTSQSALSKTIISMENELGMKLFDRKGKKLVLNDAGMRFLDSCRLILEENDSALRDLSNISSGGNNIISICAEGIMPRLYSCMAEFKKLYPNTEYIVDTLRNRDFLPDINEFDMIIYPDERRYSKYKGSFLYEEKYYFAVPAASPIARRLSAPVKELNDMDFVFIKSKDRIEFAYHVCNSLGISMKSCSYAVSRSAQREFIAAGIAGGFVPEGYAGMYETDAGIRLLPVLDSRFTRRMFICFKRDKHLSELAAAFKEYVSDYFSL